MGTGHDPVRGRQWRHGEWMRTGMQKVRGWVYAVQDGEEVQGEKIKSLEDSQDHEWNYLLKRCRERMQGSLVCGGRRGSRGCRGVVGMKRLRVKKEVRRLATSLHLRLQPRLLIIYIYSILIHIKYRFDRNC